MTGPIDSSDLGNMLSETMAALAQFQGRQAAGEAAEGAGQAANGLITVKAVPPGQISDLRLDPSLLRMASEWLAEELTKAVNQALTDLQDKANVPTGPMDLSSLGEKLKQIQADASRQFATLADSLVEAQTRIARQGGKE